MTVVHDRTERSDGTIRHRRLQWLLPEPALTISVTLSTLSIRRDAPGCTARICSGISLLLYPIVHTSTL